MRAILCIGFALTIGIALPVTAQDVGIGYQVQRISGDGLRLTMPTGFNADASVPVGGAGLNVMGQLDWSGKYESATLVNGFTAKGSRTLMSFGGGLRWTGFLSRRVAPFLQGVLGLTHDEESRVLFGVETAEPLGTNAMAQLGGGLAIFLKDKASAVAQIDLRRMFGRNEDINSMRLVLGMRIKL